MAEYDNTNRGQIWKNDKKETDKHPDFRGDINIEGKEYWLSAWKRKEGANPKAPALSLSVQLKDVDQKQPPPKPSVNDDDIPF